MTEYKLPEPVAWNSKHRGYTHYTDCKRDWYDAVNVDNVTPLFTSEQVLAAYEAGKAAISSALPDNFSESKDWKFDSDPLSRIEWLKTFHRYHKEERNELYDQLAAAQEEIETRRDEVGVEQIWVQHWHKETLTAQADNARLREALEKHSGNYKLSKDEAKVISDLLAIESPSDALREYSSKLVEKEFTDFGLVVGNNKAIAYGEYRADNIRKGVDIL
jgi:hypothetical protein